MRTPFATMSPRFGSRSRHPNQPDPSSFGTTMSAPLPSSTVRGLAEEEFLPFFCGGLRPRAARRRSASQPSSNKLEVAPTEPPASEPGKDASTSVIARRVLVRSRRSISCVSATACVPATAPVSAAVYDTAATSTSCVPVATIGGSVAFGKLQTQMSSPCALSSQEMSSDTVQGAPVEFPCAAMHCPP